MTSRVNWTIQSSGVDYLHLLIISMEYLIENMELMQGWPLQFMMNYDIWLKKPINTRQHYYYKLVIYGLEPCFVNN